MKIVLTSLLLSFAMLLGCHKKPAEITPTTSDTAWKGTKTISYNNVSVDVVIDKPAGKTFDVLLVYHGTVTYDSLILEAANNTLNGFKRILARKDMMIVSVAYPEENLLMGDNVLHSEAALLWVKNKAAGELGIQINKVFIAGHSQGGYIVTRLNTMHQTNGVIANAPGPLNLVYRCQLEEDGKIAQGVVCTAMKNKYGTTTANPGAYQDRSLLKYTSAFKSDILFVQGLDDTQIQMYSWPLFKQKVTGCTDCKQVLVHEVTGFGHTSLFENADAQTVFNKFIADR